MKKTIHDHVIKSASRLFAEKGRAAVTLEEIATLSGVASGELTELFSSESDLYRAVLDFLFSRYALLMSAALDGNNTPLDKVTLFARAFCDLHKQSPYLFTLFYHELLDPSIYFESIVLKNIRHVAYKADTNFARGIQKDIFKHGVNPAIATMLFVGMFHYYFMAKDQIGGSLLPEAVTDEEYIALALKVFLNGLQQEK